MNKEKANSEPRWCRPHPKFPKWELPGTKPKRVGTNQANKNYIEINANHRHLTIIYRYVKIN